MKIGICSYSFHRLLEAGKQDMFKYITDCKELGMTQLDPWHMHLAPLADSEEAWKAQADPENVCLSAEEQEYLDRVKRAADDVGLPFGCIAVDGAHIYEPDLKDRKANRAFAYKWLLAAERLGARQVRLDAGGPAELTDDMFQIIMEGYDDLIARGRDKGIEIIMENHWGSTNVPANVVKIIEAADGLGLLFDTHNWGPGLMEEGWQTCAKYAKAVHIKTFAFDQDGNETSGDMPRVMRLLIDAGYDDCWGIESCPKDGDEYQGARQTVALIKRVLGELG
ncbi:MAG: TIM barrel protein [Chloroflexi bacterium]|nr:TIM barrel protein [Chloroflexota bacterium]